MSTAMAPPAGAEDGWEPGRSAEPPVTGSVPWLEITAHGRVKQVNDACCALLRRTREQVVGLSLEDLSHPEDIAALQDLLRASRRHEQHRVVEQRFLRPDGTALHVRVASARHGHAASVWLQVVDITDLVHAREEALAERARAAALIEHSNDIIAVLDGNARLMDANPAAERLLGWRVADQVEANMLDLVHPDDLARVSEELRGLAAKAGSWPPVEFRIAAADGSWVHLEAVGNNQLATPAVRGLIINARDVTQRILHQRELEAGQDALIASLIRATEVRDPYTAGHQLKVSVIADRIARCLGLGESELRLISLGANVHDLGKIAVPAEILTRPGRLSPLEYEVVKTHCRVGFDILAGTSVPATVSDIVLHHHERIDGSGYPDGLCGDQISLAARVVGVADVLDAITSHRPYRPALGLDVAHQEVRTNSGRLYDPDVVDAALEVTSGAEPTAGSEGTS